MSIKDQIAETDKLWYAVYCKYRCEKKLQSWLQLTGVEVYVPIQKKLRQYASRKKYSEVALIPSHIFVKINRPDYLKVLNHRHVYRFLSFSGTIIPIPQYEMDLMKRVVGEYEDIVIENIQYTIGDDVQIISGELTGLRGTLIERSNHNFKIALQSLGLEMIIHVDPKCFIKIGSSKKVA